MILLILLFLASIASAETYPILYDTTGKTGMEETITHLTHQNCIRLLQAELPVPEGFNADCTGVITKPMKDAYMSMKVDAILAGEQAAWDRAKAADAKREASKQAQEEAERATTP